MNIVFRVDSSSEIGVGHVVRCLTLADELLIRKVKITFICRDLPGHIGDLIHKKGYVLKLMPCLNLKNNRQSNSWLKVPWSIDVADTVNMIESKIDLLVVDHYGIDAKWHQRISPYTNKIMVIDDLANRKLHCDILLDQTFGREKTDFIKYVNAKTLMLLGTKYALLRPQFAKRREDANTKRKLYMGIKHVLISFGGADFNNNSEHVLRLLSSIEFTNKPTVDIVLGSGSLNKCEIEKAIKKQKLEINVLMNVDDMAELMFKADVAIGAGGTTSWERCTLGLPTILLIDADNQLLIAENLDTAGAVYAVNKSSGYGESIKQKIEILDREFSAHHLMSQSAAKICDGLGVKRVAEKLFSLNEFNLFLLSLNE